MNVDMAIFAEFAEVTGPQSLFTIRGGGGDTLVVDAVPAHRSIYMALQVSFARNEWSRTYKLMLQVRDRGGSISGEETWDLEVGADSSAQKRTASVRAALLLEDVLLPRLGEYEVRVMINGALLKKVPFFVEIEPSGPFRAPNMPLVA